MLMWVHALSGRRALKGVACRQTEVRKSGRGEPPRVRDITLQKLQCGNCCIDGVNEPSFSTGCDSNTFNSVSRAKQNIHFNSNANDRLLQVTN